jgi:hypothetical protein
MRGTSVGVHSPSRPASSSVGCSALLGQTFMHSPQRMQRERNSRLVERARRTQQPFVAALAQAGVGAHQRHKRRARRQPVSVLRRPRSGEATSCSLRKKRKARPSCGQLPTQFMHIRHSDLRQGTPPMGSSPPWQLSRQRLHLSQAGRVLVQPQHAPARDRAQQRAQRANRPAPQPRHAQAGQPVWPETECPAQPLRKVRLAEIQHRELQNQCAAFRRST